MRVSSRRGFTLLETVIAMGIMAAGLLLLVNTWGGSFLRLERTQKAFEFAALLERKMIDIDIKYRGKPLAEIPEGEDGDFEGFPEYTWKLESHQMEFPDLSGALVGKEGGADAMTLAAIKQLTETLSKGIKEVVVTVTYKRKGKKPLVNSIATYYVNYDQAPQIGISR